MRPKMRTMKPEINSSSHY